MNQWRINNMENVILNKSFEFAVSIVKMSRWLQEEKRNTHFQNRFFVPEQALVPI